MRQENLLFTEEEFSNHYTLQDESNKTLVLKTTQNQLERILGAQYIQRTAQQIGLKHIYVPQIVAVIKNDAKEISISIGGYLNPVGNEMEIYVEYITALKRKATKEEILEFIEIIEHTGYGDFPIGFHIFHEKFTFSNVILGKNSKGIEGFYFIETECNSFRGNPFTGSDLGKFPGTNFIAIINQFLPQEKNEEELREINLRFEVGMRRELEKLDHFESLFEDDEIIPNLWINSNPWISDIDRKNHFFSHTGKYVFPKYAIFQ